MLNSEKQDKPHKERDVTKFEERHSVILENQGQKMFGVLHRPLIQGKVPAVLICHGLDGTKVSRYRLYVMVAEQLAQKGIATLRLDSRGSGDSEGHFSEISIAGRVEDALIAMQFLEKDSQIDASRLGMIGRSLGGAVAVKASRINGRAKSIALLSPLFGNRGGYTHLAPGLLEKLVATRILDLAGAAPGNSLVKELLSLDLEPELEALRAVPLLHIQGLKDQTIGLDQAEHYERCRSQATALSKFVSLEKSTHEYIDFAERMQVISETVNWLETTL